jgi:hypothetical protein
MLIDRWSENDECAFAHSFCCLTGSWCLWSWPGTAAKLILHFQVLLLASREMFHRIHLQLINQGEGTQTIPVQGPTLGQGERIRMGLLLLTSSVVQAQIWTGLSLFLTIPTSFSYLLECKRKSQCILRLFIKNKRHVDGIDQETWLKNGNAFFYLRSELFASKIRKRGLLSHKTNK